MKEIGVRESDPKLLARRVEELERELLEAQARDRERVELRRQLIRAEEQLERLHELERAQHEYRREREQLLEQLASARASVQEYAESTSWKLTKPLRQASRAVSRRPR